MTLTWKVSQFSIAFAVALSAAGACYSATEPATSVADGATPVGDDGALRDAPCSPTLDSLVQDIFAPSCATSGATTQPARRRRTCVPCSAAPRRSAEGRPWSARGSGRVVVAAKPSCGDPMPLGGVPLSAAEVACIREWVAGLPVADADASADSSTPTDSGAVDSGPSCAAPAKLCGATCVDTQTDPANCGACGKTCPVACSGGACVAQCPNGTKSCSGACVNTQTDSANCGACGVVCAAGKTCNAGACSCGPSVSFAGTLQPILTANCATNGCHAGNRPASSLDLGVGKAYASLVGVGSSTCGGRTRVLPGNVAGSYLINKLTGVDLCAGTQMPKAGASLPAAQLDAFKTWVCNGATNN
ncbi:hypothetical protein OUZ56_032390 [Daphnia magna]|uniref:Tryptophan synthase alpha chain n=1 Tax=Daphnia magna TaxID=35525 RepID=A0ABR0B8S9_9CRUS|nr:hypothetical protein OUZ56_032390 [Daphnia magna]